MHDAITGRDLYLRRTQANGNSTVSEHRVWDVDRFLAARIREADVERDDPERQDDRTRLVKVELATREAYEAARG